MRTLLKKLTNSSLTVETVRAAMAQRGWKACDLAARCGITKESFAVKMAMGLPEQPLRSKIESVFDYEFSLGTDAKILVLRRRCKEALQFDPYLLSKDELCQRCESLNIRDWRSARTKGALLEKLFSHFAANASLLNAQNTNQKI